MMPPDDAGTPRQLPLALPAENSFAREDFLVGPSNRAALELIDRWPQWPARIVVLWGPLGAGKSHLIAAWAAATGASIFSAADLGRIDPVAAVAHGPVAVEDVDGGPIDEVGLFHLVNAANAGGHLILSARTPPSQWGVRLPDLASRLRAATRVEIDEPDDGLLLRVLVKLFSDRQLVVDPGVLSYALARMERSFAGANALVEQVDRLALALRRPVTRAMVADVMARMESERGHPQ
ncbi:hypothetical protein [Pseudoxanthobacter sp.]|uniref:hypothetical protein n=1 Tax=Pseudoxanthobacter sp. TaxID=1925742 RepID=UPI002FE2691F